MKIDKIIENGNSAVVEVIQVIEVVTIKNFFYFYKDKLIVSDYFVGHSTYNTKYYDNVYAILGENYGLRIYNLDNGEDIYSRNKVVNQVASVGENFICFTNDTFIDLTTKDKKTESAWKYLKDEVDDKKLVGEYVSMDYEMPYIFEFKRREGNNNLVYSISDYVEGEWTEIYSVKIQLGEK